MYTQLYFHHVRRIYDAHLKQFLKAWLPGGKFSVDVTEHLKNDRYRSYHGDAACQRPIRPRKDMSRRGESCPRTLPARCRNHRCDRQSDPEAGGKAGFRVAEKFWAAHKK